MLESTSNQLLKFLTSLRYLLAGIQTLSSPAHCCLGGDSESQNADLGDHGPRFDSRAAVAEIVSRCLKNWKHNLKSQLQKGLRLSKQPKVRSNYPDILRAT